MRRLGFPLLWVLCAGLVAASAGCGPIGSEGTSRGLPANGLEPTGQSGSGGPTGSAGGSPSAGGSGSEVTGPLPIAVGTPNVPWQLTGIIGTGQSLSVGAQAGNLTPKAMQQQGNNLKLSLGALTGWPLDPNDPALSLVPLVEPIRQTANTYPSAYPRNLYGESPHTAMSAQLTALAKAGGLDDLVSVHTVVGESGQGMNIIRKGATEVVMGTNGAQTQGRAYAATLFEARAIRRLAEAEGKTYGIGAIFLTHGESDAGNANYGSDMLQLWSDYNADLKAITGQEQSIPLFTSQQHGIYMYALGQAPRNMDTSTGLQWKAAVDHPAEIVCTGPKYQYPYDADWLHLQPRGYELMGEKYAQVYYERIVLGNDWRPLQPLPDQVARSGRNITVDFHVPVPPLAFDDALPRPHEGGTTEWAQGRGFEVRMGATRLAIESVQILDADTVQITCAADVPAGVTLGYAASSDGAAQPFVSPRWGQLKDSDPFVGEFTGQAQPNYSVSFELTVP